MLCTLSKCGIRISHNLLKIERAFLQRPSALSFSDRMIFCRGCIFHPIHLCIGKLQSPWALAAFYCLWIGMLGQPQKLTRIPRIYERGIIEGGWGVGKWNSGCLTWYYWQVAVSLWLFVLYCLWIGMHGNFFENSGILQKAADNDQKWQTFLQKWRENTDRFFGTSDARHLTFWAALLRTFENFRSWQEFLRIKFICYIVKRWILQGNI